ncbi:MAG: membrane protein insertion efficiency factor YidD [Candidatus Kerfeldbacteria bacterium]|nr:membrane protein insertion efficiency factor YidD [Candidatus Kerfeldbacteria bacterium]
MKSVVLGLIRFYQLTISPDHGWARLVLARAGCRFYPSCSEYFYQAISYYGVIKGAWLGLGRLGRCHPWSKGGFDLLKRN